MNESFHLTLIYATYQDMGSVKYVLFTGIFLIYFVSLIVNISVLLLIYLDISLHKPIDFLPKELNAFVSMNYVLFPPLMHPVIYGLKNKEIQHCLSKMRKKAMFVVSQR
ncbi:olfactory receptor 2L2-like [Alosa alosa]|uniref:olfactory receptor 2L2-like n=1 Tax=Alosa alosa TaxID=278164 RepID=UPI002015037B|nr:olfactory receptor 2L2-like [Alosa alosa]